MSNKSILTLALLATATAAQAQVFTNADAYALPTWYSPYTVEPILSVGDTVPRTSNTAQQYQMTGIPDGLGVHTINQLTAAVYMNHEFTASILTRPIIGQPKVRGSYVSKFILDRQRRGVLRGDIAFSNVYIESTLAHGVAMEDNAHPAFSRLCSGSIAGPREGMDRYIYLAGEESEGDTYNTLGGSAVAFIDGNAHVLPGLGHFPWENLLIQPRIDTGLYANKTVIMLMEDGPANSPYCGMFMYVGTKNRTSSDPLVRNGLVGGQFYVLRGLNEDANYEFDFYGEGNATQCEWVRIPNIASKSYTQLKDAAIAQDFFRFARVEDGAWSKVSKTDFFYVTTGGDGVVGDGTGNNKLGRLYRLTLDANNPLGYANLEIIGDADHSNHADLPLSPDNMDTSSRYVMINEDGTSQSRPVMAARNRDGSIWRYDMWDLSAAPLRVAQQTSIGRDGVYAVTGAVVTPGSLPVTPTFTTSKYTPTARGIWETSGIHATDAEFGDGTFIFDVQAHSPTAAPGDSTREDGQLLILIPNP
jgi:hypothetical protein